MRIIGLDIHRAFAEAVAWEDGKLKRLGRVDMRRELLTAFARGLSQDGVVVVEATGNAAAVAAALAPHVKKVVIANPKQVRIIAYAKIKTDTIDAGVLAQLYASCFLRRFGSLTSQSRRCAGRSLAATRSCGSAPDSRTSYSRSCTVDPRRAWLIAHPDHHSRDSALHRQPANGSHAKCHLHDDSNFHILAPRKDGTMQRKSFGAMPCPIARSLERVGEWWSILILRDAFAGMTRFEEFRESLGIAPNMLTRRLNALVEAGLLERRRYSERPPRDEYRLTDRGRDFRPVLLAMLAFGNRHFAPEGASVEIVDAKTGKPADPVLVDRLTGRPLVSPEFKLAPGPAARESTRRRLATSAARPSRR